MARPCAAPPSGQRLHTAGSRHRARRCAWFQMDGASQCPLGLVDRPHSDSKARFLPPILAGLRPQLCLSVQLRAAARVGGAACGDLSLAHAFAPAQSAYILPVPVPLPLIVIMTL